MFVVNLGKATALRIVSDGVVADALKYLRAFRELLCLSLARLEAVAHKLILMVLGNLYHTDALDLLIG